MSNPVDEKTQKYDRQLRLWATSGQQALEDANICLLNATPTGCEIIKNLILPGIGNVTIVDGEKVTKEDIRSNFFLATENIGQSRAQATSELLQELNEDTLVEFFEKDPSVVINDSPEFFDKFSMIVVVNMSEKDLSKLASICQEHHKTLINVKSKGLVGVFSIQAPEHTVIDSHPENFSDLRISNPFQQLTDYVSTINLEDLDQTDHAHVPYVVLVLKYAEKYKLKNNGQQPHSYDQRKEVKQMMRDDMKTPDEENFEEAISNLWRLSPSNSLSKEICQIFEDPSCQNVHGNSPHFWILARATRDFVENEGEGQLPLSGKLPDMKADTTSYIHLQNVYREKALADMKAIKERVKILLEGSDVTIPDETIELFCKNASSIKVIKYQPLTESHIQVDKFVELIKDENFCYYLVYKAADKFQIEYKHLPSGPDDDKKLKEQVQLLIEGIDAASVDAKEVTKSDTMQKSILNFVRFGNLETPNLAALLGGLVAQEAIKLITHQYIPINNTCVFNGITSTSSVFEI